MEMTLTHKAVQAYVGGQAEIQNSLENYLYRGEIQSIDIVNKELKIMFAWVGKMTGGVNSPTGQWIKDDRLDYAASLEIYNVSDISLKRIALNSFIVGELVVLFPPDGSKLDKSKIEGL